MNDPTTLWGWRKSKRSGDNKQCVEISLNPTIIGIRDSKDPNGPYLTFSPESWECFTLAVKSSKLN